ncbi:MAG: acyl-CoA thioesterase [bacterium]|nr:MAG: acyl-CoA thioesterase [bacterium]
MRSEFKFSTEINVRISDINYGGHLANDRYLSFFQDARLRYLKQFGYSELSIGDDISLIMSQAHIDFKAEAFWGDRLTIYVRISKIKPAKFIMEYLMVNNKDQAKVVAMGYTEMVGFDYQNRKVKKLPSKFVRDIQDFEKNVEIS